MKTAEDNTNLPDGFACDDCRHFHFCVPYGVAKAGQTQCDWFPIRFSFSLSKARDLKRRVAELEAEKLEAK